MARNKYKWDGDSRDERPSEFAQSTFAPTTAGAFHSTWAQTRARRKRRVRLAGLVAPLLVAVCVSGLVLYGLVSHLRG